MDLEKALRNKSIAVLIKIRFSFTGFMRSGDWGEIQNNAHRVPSMHSRSSLFSVVFMCLISPTQKFKLEKSTLNTKE